MALPKFYKVCQDQQGNIVPQVLGSVFNHGTAVLASLYQDDAGTVPLSNPMTSDAQYGSFKFYISPGHYDLTFTKPGYTFEPINDLQVPQDVLTLGTMATQNANAVAITGGTATGLTVPNTPGNGQFGLYSQLQEAGGTNRYFLISDGNAPSLLRGNIQVGNQPGLFVDVVNGRVGIKNFGPIAAAALRIHHPRATEVGLWLQPTDTDTGGNNTVQFANTGGSGVGSITCTATATSYNTSSDLRLKHSVAPLTDSLAVIAALNPVSHLWNVDDSYAENFLAHELQRVLPYAVTGEPDAVNDDGSIRPQQVDASKLIPRLVGAVKELLASVDTLTARVAALETALGL